MTKVIGISGISGSGKTTLTKNLAKMLGATAVYWDEFDEVSQSPEDYVAWYEAGKPEGLAAWKYPELASTVVALRSGKSLTCPATGRRLKATEWIIFDAPLGRDHEETGRFIDLWIHMEVPADVALCRRILRDFPESSGASDILEDIQFYLEKSRPLFMEQPFYTPDFVVDGSKPLETVLEAVTGFISENALTKNSVERQRISFVAVTEHDFPELNRWLRIPHVAKWWYPDILPWDEFYTKYKRNLDSKYVEGYVICIGSVRVGFIQGYNASKFPDEEGQCDPEGTWGMDLYISDQNFLGMGFGTRILMAFMEKLCRDHFVQKFIIDPHSDNEIAIRTYRKVGFLPVRKMMQSYGEVLLMEKVR